MRKISTLFKRDPDDMRRVLPEVTPGCEWVLAGEGVATRKYDGTCVSWHDNDWRRERRSTPSSGASSGGGYVVLGPTSADPSHLPPSAAIVAPPPSAKDPTTEEPDG